MRQFTEDEIKMADCPEIQAQRPIVKDWDYGFDIETCVVGVKVSDDFQQTIEESYGVPTLGDDYYETWIWLPLEHQLWEMLGVGLWAKSLAFEYFLREEKTYEIKEYPYQFNSLWQLLLAFVMHELYGKKWIGEEWVKE